MSDLKVHRIRFFLSEVTSINCLSFCEDTHRLAIVRRRVRKYKTSQLDTQSLVEIWNMKSSSPFVEQTIHDDSNNPSLLEGLLWAPKGRLFSCGLNAYINEYDLTNNRIKNSWDVRSGAVWCMALSPNGDRIAVGTENGSVCVYTIGDQSLDFDKFLHQNESRILCIDWSKSQDINSQLAVIGSIDCIKILDYQMGRCVDHIEVGTQGVVVWCLTVLKDMTIISGDSNGKTCFWNGKTTALIKSFNNHRGDVLSLCVNSEQTDVYSSGVDPMIASFKRTADSWAESVPRRFHTHDVRALAYVRPNWLISGGVDTYLTLSCYPPNLQLRYLTDLSSKVTIIENYVLLQFEKLIEIWRLGKSDRIARQTEENIEMLPLIECPVKLTEIKPRKAIITASFNHQFVIHSDVDNIRIKFWSETTVRKVGLLSEPIPNASQIQFCGNSFAAVATGATVHVLKLDAMGVVVQTSLKFDKRIFLMTASDHHLVVSLCDNKNSIIVYETKEWTQVCNFANSSLPTALQLNPFRTEGELWMGSTNRKLIHYNIKKDLLVETIKTQDCISTELIQSIDDYWSIKQICFARNAVLFNDDNNLFKYDRSAKRMTKCDKYRHIVKMGNQLTENELVLVEVTPEMLFDRLPRALAKKKFNT